MCGCNCTCPWEINTPKNSTSPSKNSCILIQTRPIHDLYITYKKHINVVHVLQLKNWKPKYHLCTQQWTGKLQIYHPCAAESRLEHFLIQMEQHSIQIILLDRWRLFYAGPQVLSWSNNNQTSCQTLNILCYLLSFAWLLLDSAMDSDNSWLWSLEVHNW